jgi:hypothetical protein
MSSPQPSLLRRFFRIAILLHLALLFTSWPVIAAEDQVGIPVSGSSGLPFQPGEKFIYVLRWGLISAGQAELEVLPMAEIDGIPAWHFQLTIRTNDFVDVFYKVRDKIEAYAILSLEESLLYRQSQQEGKTRREVEVLFDLENNRASYANHGEKLPPIEIAAGTIDPLTALYFIRSQPLREEFEIVRPITDGKRSVDGVARVLRREEVEVEGTLYDTFRIEPDLKGVRGVFEKSDKSRLTLWITTDEQRTVVMIKSKVVIGSFTGTLIDKS